MSALRDAFVAYAKATPTIDGHTWNQYCALGMSRFQNYLGGWATAPRRFGPYAKSVALDSGPLNKDAATAPIGAYHFWSVGTAGHVGIDLDGGGSAVGMMGTAKLAIAYHAFIGIVSVAGYGTSTYMGWATNYAGGIGRRPAEPQPAALGPTQRQVKPGIKANRRSGPGVNFPEAGAELPAGTVGNFNGWANGPVDTKGTIGPWFRGISGNWFAALCFTDEGTHDLVDLNPPPVTVEPEPIPDPPVTVPDPPLEPLPEPEPPVIEPEPTPDPPVDPVEPPVEPDPPVIVDPPAKPPVSDKVVGVVAIALAVIAAIGGFFAWLFQ